MARQLGLDLPDQKVQPNAYQTRLVSRVNTRGRVTPASKLLNQIHKEYILDKMLPECGISKDISNETIPSRLLNRVKSSPGPLKKRHSEKQNVPKPKVAQKPTKVWNGFRPYTADWDPGKNRRQPDTERFGIYRPQLRNQFRRSGENKSLAAIVPLANDRNRQEPETELPGIVAKGVGTFAPKRWFAQI